MKITKIQLININCWINREINNFTKYNVFIGENSIGKSSILKSIVNFAYESNPRKLMARKTYRAHISITLSLSKKDIYDFLDFQSLPTEYSDSDQENYVLLLLKAISKIEFRSSYEKDGRAEDFLPFRENTSIDSNFFTNVIRDNSIRNNLGLKDNNKIRNKFRQMLQNNLIYITSRRRLNPSGESSANQFQKNRQFNGEEIKRILLNAKNSSDLKIIDGFQKFQKIVSEWSFVPGKPDVILEDNNTINLIFRLDNDIVINIEEVGDGIIESVIIAGICLTYPDHIFLIEEPERHLHPRALRELRDLFKYEIKGQIILTTHSPTFINIIDNETTIFKLVKKNNNRLVIPITNKTELFDFRTQFGLLPSDFLFVDIIVLVEGYTDVVAFQNMFEMLYPHNMTVQFLDIGGDGNVMTALALSYMVQLQINFSLFSILDSDGRSPEEKRNEILSKVKSTSHHSIKEIGEDKIINSIYILNKVSLEAYFNKVPRLIARLFNVDVNDVENFFENNKNKKSAVGNLKRLAKSLGKSFDKARDIPKLVENLKVYEIDPEIQRLMEKIKNLSNRN